jgi:hypothetical protein
LGYLECPVCVTRPDQSSPLLRVIGQYSSYDKGVGMPRYMVERVFPEGLNVPVNSDGAAALNKVVETNSEQGVTWVHSYVSADKTRTYCIYDAPTPDAIRQVAERNSLPVNEITEVSVLAPYFYH